MLLVYLNYTKLYILREVGKSDHVSARNSLPGIDRHQKMSCRCPCSLRLNGLRLKKSLVKS